MALSAHTALACRITCRRCQTPRNVSLGDAAHPRLGAVLNLSAAAAAACSISAATGHYMQQCISACHYCLLLLLLLLLLAASPDAGCLCCSCLHSALLLQLQARPPLAMPRHCRRCSAWWCGSRPGRWCGACCYPPSPASLLWGPWQASACPRRSEPYHCSYCGQPLLVEGQDTAH
jgi:hypothetical protein